MGDGAGNYNLRNPAVKRIMQEMKELQKDQSQDYAAEALQDNLFEWHFAIRGPPDTEFEGGIYHGRILLPPEYPFKPPSFVMLTPNGRFQLNTKICLSISSFHPEEWQPSWSLRTALTALIAFMPTAGNGAIGSLDYPKEDRRQLARKSIREIPLYGTEDRKELMKQLHASIASGAASGSSVSLADSTSTPSKATITSVSNPSSSPDLNRTTQSSDSGSAERVPSASQLRQRTQAAAENQQVQQGQTIGLGGRGVVGQSPTDYGDAQLTAVAWLLCIAIALLVGRKLLVYFSQDPSLEMEM